MPTQVTYWLPGHQPHGAGPPAVLLTSHSQVTLSAPCPRNTSTMCCHDAQVPAGRPGRGRLVLPDLGHHVLQDIHELAVPRVGQRDPVRVLADGADNPGIRVQGQAGPERVGPALQFLLQRGHGASRCSRAGPRGRRAGRR